LLPDFLPSASAGHLLLTTRATAMGRLAHRIEIENLEPEQGALFLLRRATLLVSDGTLEQASSQQQTLAQQISQELGGLPLALDQAGAYLEETGIDLSSYWQVYQQHRADLLSERRGLVADHPEPVASTWSLSFQRVEAKNPAAADLLRLCAFLAPDAIPEEILTTGASLLGPVLAPIAADAFLLNQAIETLRAYSLVRRDPSGKILSIHRLVQAVLQEAMSETEQHTWAERVVLAINAVLPVAFPFRKHETWPQYERLLSQALTATQLIEQYQISSWEAGHLFAETAFYFDCRARYAEAEPLYQRALHLWEQTRGLKHPDVADLLNCLANLYKDQGKYVEAEPLFQRALHIREQSQGLEHPEVASQFNDLANLYKDQGKYAEAESLYLRALRIREQSQEPEHLQVAGLLYNLASLYREQGKYAEAESLYQQSLHIWKQGRGPEHYDLAYPFNGLAKLYLAQGKYAEAEPLFQQALHLWEQQLGPEHPQVASPLNSLANLYQEKGKYTEAKAFYLRALAVREQALGRHHRLTTETRTCLIALLRTMGQHEEAVQLEAVQSEL
jgi:tetratricopeptide (TPR) repeat protein